MNKKKILPIVFLVVLALAALLIKRFENNAPKEQKRTRTSQSRNSNTKDNPRFDRSVAKFYFTKHAKCRMKCRQITQQEVKEI
jgi:hypothetical protein